MPIPSHQHCGVCRCNYEDFQQHIESQEHKSQITVGKNIYELIDFESIDLNEKAPTKNWKTSPLRTKVPELEKLVSVVKPLDTTKNDDTTDLNLGTSTGGAINTVAGTSQITKSTSIVN